MIAHKQLVFIIGSPRSGTTWLQAMVAAHPSVCSTIDELKLFDFFTVPLEEGWKYLLSLQTATGGGRNGLAAMWTDAEFYEFLREFVERVYTQVSAMKPEATVLLDKAPAYSTSVDHINRLLPGVKFIHMIRDGRDVAVSLMAAAREWGRLWAPGEVKAAAETWKSHVLGARQANHYTDRYLEVRYEELQSNGVQSLEAVFEFLGVPFKTATVSGIYEHYRFENMKKAGAGVHDFVLPANFFRKGQSGDWRHSLNPRQRYIFHRAAGDLLCELGYSDESWWFDNAYQRSMAPLLARLSSRESIPAKGLRAIRLAVGAK